MIPSLFILQLPASPLGTCAIPQPYRDLLDHDDSMTFRLERRHGQRMGIEVLGSRVSGDGTYEREIVMRGMDDGEPRQLAHIRIHLNRVAEIREQVLAAVVPFGRLLAERGIAVQRRDMQFLEFPPAAVVRDRLNGSGQPYYGRRYTIARVAGDAIADVVEIVR